MAHQKNMPTDKLIEEVLRKSQSKYAALFHQSNDAIIMHDLDGNIIDINLKAIELFGYEKSEFLSIKVPLLHPTNAIGKAKWAFETIVQKGHVRFEINFSKKNGEQFYADVSSSIIEIEEGKIIQGIIKDVTDQKYTEEALRKSEERYQAVSQLTSDYSYAYRVELDGELKSEWVTGALKDLTGFSQEEIYSRGGWESLIFPEDMPIPITQLKSLHSNQPKTVEYRVIDKEGNIRWMRDFAKPMWDEKENRLTMIFGAVKEITEQKQAMEDLRSSQERFLTVLNSIDATVYVADMETYEILFMNKFMIDSYGQNLTGKICWDVFRGESQQCGHCTNDKLITENGEPKGVCVWQGNNPITGKWYVNYDRAITWTDGRMVRIQIATDITDLKEMEEKLQQAQKLEAVGTLAGGIAHNFNNLLMGIQGHASLMLADMDSTHTYFENVNAINKYVSSAVDLTKQLLGFVRGGKYEVKPIDLNRLVKESANMFGRTRKEIKIHTEVKNSNIVVEVDRSQIEQVLMNLFVNAWQAMPNGGDLYLEISSVNVDEVSKGVHKLFPGRYGKISVTDTGTGMDEATLGKIFDPFFTTKEKSRGTGLGLASVYGIINNHMGEITVKSQVGKGTTFNVYLPISKKDVLQGEISTDKSIKGSETILIVDDEEMIIEVGEAMLKKLGYNVITSGSGQEAIEMLTERGEAIDLVILDMIMPGMDGGKTFDRIREIQPEIPVIISSGYAINGQATDILKRGCNGFIQKPYDLSALSKKIRNIVGDV
ncbi:MAG: PAS domain S-box protein [Deltaproteobacteria bacterium]|nr:PAS domain S-box protein [Deltaproteobacteria bacterium]